MKEQLYAEPILGWRAWWKEDSKPPILLSGHPFVGWPYKEPLRAVHQERHSYSTGYPLYKDIIPSPPCGDAPCEIYVPRYFGCGIYAWKTPLSLACWRQQRSQWTDDALFLICGTVLLWGRIFEHEHGYRAQFAYPASFIYGENLEELAQAYSVPIDKENELWKLANLSVGSSLSPSTYPNLAGAKQIPLPQLPYQSRSLWSWLQKNPKNNL